MSEGDVPVSFSIGADSTDKKELGRLRFDMMYDLKYLLAYPIIDRKSYIHLWFFFIDRWLNDSLLSSASPRLSHQGSSRGPRRFFKRGHVRSLISH